MGDIGYLAVSMGWDLVEWEERCFTVHRDMFVCTKLKKVLEPLTFSEVTVLTPS